MLRDDKLLVKNWQKNSIDQEAKNYSNLTVEALFEKDKIFNGNSIFRNALVVKRVLCKKLEQNITDAMKN